MLLIENISRIYRKGTEQVKALDNVSINIDQGEFLVVRGPSGSGKTTLLLSIGGMLSPNTGRIIIDNNDIYGMNQNNRAHFRKNNIGFVFQMFYLVPYLNIVDNVLLACNKPDISKGREKALNLLDRLGLSERAFHKPSELSAGEKQRTAIARAVFNEPKIILADEPTGNLDPDNTAVVNESLANFHRGGGTVIVVTHDIETDKYSDRIIHLQKGCLVNNS